jgi:transcriptional regulator with XRE-family HTH domain
MSLSIPGTGHFLNGKGNNMKNFGKRLRALRKHHGYTQQYVAEQVGVKRVSVTNWELGNTGMMAEPLLKCALLFSVNPYWLLFGEPNLRKKQDK